MVSSTRRVAALVLAVTGGLFLTIPVRAATPLFTCMSSLLFVSDRAGQPEPAEHELLTTTSSLPDTIPLLTLESGFDYCVRYLRSPFDEATPAVDTGTVSLVVYKLNARGKWRKLVRVPAVDVENDTAFACKNSKKRLQPGDKLRWVIRSDGLPNLGYYDLYGFDTMIVTGGAGEAMASAQD